MATSSRLTRATMSKRRRTVVDDLRALMGGGVEALRVAEEITRADDQIQIRVSRARKELYAAAAKRAGFVRGGKPNVSAWLISLADDAAEG